MTMNHRTSRILVLPACAYGFPINAQAQDPRSGVLRWTVSVNNAVDRLPVARSYRLYSTPDVISLQLVLSNQSPVMLALDPSAFLANLALRITDSSGATLPTRLEWGEGRQSGQPLPFDLSAGAVVDLLPGSGCGLMLKVALADGVPFTNGTYDIHITAGPAIAGIRDVNGQLWLGRYLQETALRLEMAPPRTTAERAEMYRRLGIDALTAGHTEQAIEMFTSALNADPTDLLAVAELGEAYLAARRFRDAIPTLERAMAGAQSGHSVIPDFLALAYMNVGDEANARRALRRAGRSEAAVTAAVEKLRARVRQR